MTTIHAQEEEMVSLPSQINHEESTANENRTQPSKKP